MYATPNIPVSVIPAELTGGDDDTIDIGDSHNSLRLILNQTNSSPISLVFEHIFVYT
jgi:hypothetical protein